jgi:hypothetical protein
MWSFSWKSLDYAFAAQNEKEDMRKIWKEWEDKNFDSNLMNSRERNE